MSRSLVSLLAVAALLAQGAVCARPTDEDDGFDDAEDYGVRHLTEATFGEVVRTPEPGQTIRPVFVKFFAPWCGHCVSLAPVWEDLSRELAKEVSVAKVDCTVETGVCSKEGVEGYPTLIFYDNAGRGSRYEGSRSPEAMRLFARRMAGPAAKEVKTAGEWRALAFAAKDTASLLVLPRGADAKALEDFAEACSQVKAVVTCAYSSSAEVLALAGASEAAGAYVALYKEGEFTATGPGDLLGFPAKLAEVMKRNRFPTMSVIGPETYSELINSGRKLVIAVVDPLWKKKESLLASLTSLAKNELKGSGLLFSHIDGVQYADFTKQYGVAVDALPQLLVQDGPDGTYWNSGTEFKVTDKKAVTEWLQGIVSGKIAGKGGGFFTAFSRFLEDYVPILHQQPLMALGLVVIGFGLLFFTFCMGKQGGDDQQQQQQGGQKNENDKKDD
jgi:protein disulfide-isomerase-like protein